MKGVLLAGGRAARLWPVSQAVNKHLLPVYDRPMIHYPLHTLINAGVREILLITGADCVESFVRLLGTGEKLGCQIEYVVQEKPSGTGAAILLAEPFTGGEDFVVMLGDNLLTEGISEHVGIFEFQTQFAAKILVGKVKDPHRYGVVVFRNGGISDVIEKPANPPSRYVNTGVWMLRPDVYSRLRTLSISPRAEYEMTDVLAGYARDGLLGFARLKRKWMDLGSFESLYEATALVRRAARRHETVNISFVGQRTSHHHFRGLE